MRGEEFYTLNPEHNCQHFVDDIFKKILLNENNYILIQISLKFVPRGLIENKSALIQTGAWCWTGNMSVPEPVMTVIDTVYYKKINKKGKKWVPSKSLQPCLNQWYQLVMPHTITRTHWVNSLWPSDAIWQYGNRSTLAQVMAWCLTAPGHGPMLANHRQGPIAWGHYLKKIWYE